MIRISALCLAAAFVLSPAVISPPVEAQPSQKVCQIKWVKVWTGYGWTRQRKEVCKRPKKG